MRTGPISLTNAIAFVRRQHRDWLVIVARSSLDKLDYQLVFPYLSIYIMALGASATQLGIVNSLGLFVAGIISPLTGWFIDRAGPKRIYLLGIGLVAVAYLTYSIAQNWTMTIMAMIAYRLGNSVSMHSCATVCGNCLANEDRATGMMVCETAASGVLGMIGPMIGAWLVTGFGGVTVDGIRPLFLFAMAGTIGSLALVSMQLSKQRWRTTGSARPELLRDVHKVFQEGHHLKRWLVISTIAGLPMGIVLPFSQVFAHEFKGADQFVLGAMVTGAALASITFAIPLGRLADRVGRKKVLYVVIPLFWASNLMLVWAPNVALLITAGILQGFYYIGGPISGAMERELVPAAQMGRWLGIVRFFRFILSACLVFLSGLIWDLIGPAWVFLTFVAIDTVRIPLLISMPETLRLHSGGRTPASSDSPTK